MTFPSHYHADSDADDEFERSVVTSPILPTDDEASPTDSEPASTEHTPTTFDNPDGDRNSPRTVITAWGAEDCAKFITTLGLSQYCNTFLDNEIIGEALIALRHEDLKEMGVASVGHRLTILKGVYDIKVKQDVLMEVDHYVPLSAEASQNNKKATQEDISRVIESIKLRDDKILAYETELRKITEEYRKLREELLPVFRMAKERSQPLPDHASSPDFYSHDSLASPVLAQPPPEKQSGGLARKISHKGKSLWLNSTPKNASPTYMPQSIPEGKTLSEVASGLDPSAAALAASSHLTASLGGGAPSANSPNPASLPSPTSPNNYHGPSSAASRGYGRDTDRSGPSTGRSQYGYGEEVPQFGYSSTASTLVGNDGVFRSNPTPTPGRSQAARGGPMRDQDDSPSSAGREAPSVEIFKSFRVSMEDPCYKVLPAALKKYNINADWRQYALYIVFGDQERCLGLEEKPLILFKQLDKEGRKPMFMLRRHAAPVEGHSGPTGSSMVGFEGGGLGGGRAHQSSIQLPGGVL